MRSAALTGFVLAGVGMLFVPPASGATVRNFPLTVAAPARARQIPPLRPARRGSAMGPTGCTSDSSSGPYFLGIPGGNVAGGSNSGVLAGADNEACSLGSAIGTGYGNIIGQMAGGGNAPDYAFLGGGQLNGVSGDDAFLGSGESDEATGDLSFLGAGAYNIAAGFQSFVGAGNFNRAMGDGSFIGAGDADDDDPSCLGSDSCPAGNTVRGADSFIGAGDRNTVDASEAFIGSGSHNVLAGAAKWGTIGGGHANVVAGPFATIPGGEQNSVSADFAFVGGGSHNAVAGSAEWGTIGGGHDNAVAGELATIPGGANNTAAGLLSLAAGYHADATRTGSFVWSDYVAGSSVVKDSAPDQFVVRASGGTYIYSSENLKAGVKLGAGSGTWASLSDRDAKTDIAPLDDAAVLAKVATLPVSTWRYKTEAGVRHVGPMAQDFYAAFGVGEDDRHITSIDEDGVALAAIKALHAENVRLRADNISLHAGNASLRADNANLHADNANLFERLAALAKRVDALAVLDGRVR